MTEKRTIRAKDVVNDIRQGMSNHQLMGKYKLSVKGLESILKKLEESGTLKRSELCGRIPSFDDTVNLGTVRKIRRYYCAPALSIRDAENDSNKGEILDVSERGVGVSGMEAGLGQTRTTVVDARDVDDIGALSFDAVCRWSQRDDRRTCIAGFEIVDISDMDLAKLRRLIPGATLG